MSRQSPTLDMFVAAYHEFREAVTDPSYNVTTARERLASTKGLNLDSQFVKKIRDLIVDIDEELYNSVYTFSADSTGYGKMVLMSQTRKLHMFQTVGYVEYKAYGTGERNESALERENYTLILPHHTDVRGSITCQAAGQAETTGEPPGESTKPASDEVANGKGISKEHNTVIEGVSTDEGKGKQTESALNDGVNKTSTSMVHSMLYDLLVEDATIDKGKGKQSETVGEGPKKKNKKKRKGKSKKNKMSTEDGMYDEGKSKENDDFVEASTLDKGKEKESELLIEGSATDKGKNEEFGLPPGEHEVQGAERNDYDDYVHTECNALIREANDVDFGPISDDEDDEIGRIFVNYPIENEAEQNALMALRKIHRLMRHAIRHQTATPYQLDLYCRSLDIDPLFYNALSKITEELRWNR